MKVGGVYILNESINLESKSGAITLLPIHSRFVINKSSDKIEILSISHKNTYFEVHRKIFNKYFSPTKSLHTTPIIKEWEVVGITRADFFSKFIPLDIFKNGNHIATATIYNQNKIILNFFDPIEANGYNAIVDNLAILITKTALPCHPQKTVFNTEIYRLIDSILILYLIERMNLGAMTLEDYFLNMDFDFRNTTPFTKN